MHYNRGFTLIEVIVVIGVLAISLPIILTILFSVLSQQARIVRLTQVRNEGDTIVSILYNTIINNGVTIEDLGTNPVCDDAGDTYSGNIRFRDTEGGWFMFLNDNNTEFASYSAVLLDAQLLHSDKIHVENYYISCERTTLFAPPTVTISFDVVYGAASDRPAEQEISLPYKTFITLRQYDSSLSKP